MTRDSAFPEVASGRDGAAEIRFTVIGQFDLGAATIVVGAPDAHQAVVPLRAAGGAVTLEPVAIARPAKPLATAGSLKISMLTAEIRADLPDWGLELPSATLAITITYDVAYIGTFDGGASFTADNIRLRLPNGGFIAPRRDGRSQSTTVLKPKATARSLSSRFEIPLPAGGSYQLVIQDGAHRAGVPFAVPTLR
jgi:hypothetical protein